MSAARNWRKWSTPNVNLPPSARRHQYDNTSGLGQQYSGHRIADVDGQRLAGGFVHRIVPAASRIHG